MLYSPAEHLIDFSDLGELSELRVLKLFSFSFTDVSFLTKMHQLNDLTIGVCEHCQNLSPIGDLYFLERLQYDSPLPGATIEWLSGCEHL